MVERRRADDLRPGRHRPGASRRRRAGRPRQPAQPAGPRLHRRRAARAGRRRRAGRSPGVRRRDPRPAGVPGGRAPALRLAVPGHGRATRSRRRRRPRRGTCPASRRRSCVLSNADDVEHWARVGFLYGHGASTLGVLAATAAYDDGRRRGWTASSTYLDGNRRLLGELLAERLPQVRYRPPEGTYLAWLDCRQLGLRRVGGRVLPRARRRRARRRAGVRCARRRATCG